MICLFSVKVMQRILVFIVFHPMQNLMSCMVVVLDLSLMSVMIGVTVSRSEMKMFLRQRSLERR